MTPLGPLEVGGVLESSRSPFEDGQGIFEIYASWAEKLTKSRVSILMTPTVIYSTHFIFE